MLDQTQRAPRAPRITIRVVADLCPQARAAGPPPPDPRAGRRAQSREALGQFATLVAVLLVANALLLGAQALWHRGDQAELAMWRRRLRAERIALAGEAPALHRARVSVAALAAARDTLGMRAGAARSRPALVAADRRYADARLGAESLAARHRARSLAYNAAIDSATALARAAGSRWVVFPIPVGGR